MKSAILIVAVVSTLGSFGIWSVPAEDGGKASASDYTFLAMMSDGTTPYSWDPCEPIHVVVNNRTAIKGGARLVDEAIKEVERVSGLSLVIDGPTSEKPSRSRPITVDRYAALHTPVLLAWSDPDESRHLSGDTIGYTGSQSEILIGESGRRRPAYVTGSVTLDGPQLSELTREPGGWAEARAVVMHELGHLVGLGHVKAPGEIMQPKSAGGQASWGPGDLAGLAILGSGECVT